MEEILTKEFIQEQLEALVQWGIEKLPGLLLLIIAFIIVMRVVKFLLKRFHKQVLKRIEENESAGIDKEKRATTLIGITNGVVVVALWILFAMMFLKQLGTDIAPLLAGAGILGLAVGFGAQELVRDGITGFFLLFENRIRVGDVAVVNGQGGLVEEINLRTVTLRDLSGVVHTFQNGKINTLANMTKDWSAMVFDIGVAYKEDVDKVIPVIKAVGAELKEDPEFKDNILEDLEVFGLDKFGDSAVVIKARLKTAEGKQWLTGREFNKRLKTAFDKEGIEIPFPHRTIYWGDDISPLKLSKTE